MQSTDPVVSEVAEERWSLGEEVLGNGSGLVAVEEWERLLAAIELRATATRATLQDVLAGHSPEYQGAFATSRHAAQQVNNLRKEVNSALEEAASSQSLDGIACLAAEERERIQSQLERLQALVQVLGGLHNVQNLLEQVDTQIEQQQLARAADSLGAAESSLEKVINAQGRNGDLVESKVHRGVRVQVRRKKANLKAAAENALRVSVVVEPKRLRLKVLRGGESAALEALEALDALGQLKNSLGNIGAEIMRDIIAPLLEEDVALQINTKMSESYHDLQVCSAPQNAQEPNAVFENVVHVFQFVHKYMLDSKASWMARLAPAVWGVAEKGAAQKLDWGNSAASAGPRMKAQCLSEALLQILVRALPKESSGFERFHRLATAARLCEESLESLGLVSPATQALIPFLSEAENHYAFNRRAALLVQGRNLVVTQKNYHNAETVSSAEPFSRDLFPSGAKELLGATPVDEQATPGVFRLEKMQVTTCARKQLELSALALDEAARAALNQTSETSLHLARELYITARDVLELFRSLVPLAYASELDAEKSTRTAMLFHNDCLYIAHHLVLLGFALSKRLGTCPLADQVITVDMVPAFRETAKHTLGRAVARVKDNLVVSTFTASQETTTEALLRDLRQQCSRGVHDLHAIATEWNSILPPSVASRAVVQLGNALAGACVDWIVATKGERKAALAPHEMQELQHILQAFKDGIAKDLGVACARVPGLQMERAAPNVHGLNQICAILVQYLSMHIFRDRVAQGDLSAVSLAKTKSLAAFLFPGEPYV